MTITVKQVIFGWVSAGFGRKHEIANKSKIR